MLRLIRLVSAPRLTVAHELRYFDCEMCSRGDLVRQFDDLVSFEEQAAEVATGVTVADVGAATSSSTSPQTDNRMPTANCLCNYALADVAGRADYTDAHLPYSPLSGT